MTISFWRKLFRSTDAITAEAMVRDEKQSVDRAFAQYYADNQFAAPDTTELPNIGLALSGGGIRSASFGIGVIQALANPDHYTRVGSSPDETPKPTLFQKIRYLSTVSGGGYAGTALTWFMRRYKVFPFGQKGNYCGSKQLDQSALSTDDQRSNHILSYIRQHGNYLTPPELGFSSLIGSVLSSALHSLVAYTLFFSLLMFYVVHFAASDYVDQLLQIQLDSVPATQRLIDVVQGLVNVQDHDSYHWERQRFSLFFLDFALLWTFLFVAATLLYAFTSYLTRAFTLCYSYRVRFQQLLGFLLSATLYSLLFAALPMLAAIIAGKETHLFEPETWGPMGSGLLAIIVATVDFYKQQKSGDKQGSSIVGQIIRTLAIVLLIIFLLTTAYIVGEMMYDINHTAEILRPWLLKEPDLLALLALAVLLVVNINQVSPHKMYRDRLMDTFLMDPDEKPWESIIKRSRKANKILLSELEDSKFGWSPYHLVNCNIILNNATNQKYKGRYGDSFLLSPRYCGSDATGYTKTEDFSLGAMTVATAMAISGAATNPHSAVAGAGATTNPLVSFLMTFFGLRLGFWTHNPRSCIARWLPFLRPNYLLPGACGLFNFGHNESSPYAELSDGGHFDNTGIYELIRRRLPFIILSDGSADPETKFDDLGNCIERVRVDFGVTIRFPDANHDLSGLIPESQAVVSEGAGEPKKIYDEKYRLSQRGYAIGRIYYPAVGDEPALEGKLVYIKASMTRNLPGDIYSYFSLNPDFPNQPTSDQFFDERQFESYRELGYQLAKQYIQEHE